MPAEWPETPCRESLVVTFEKRPLMHAIANRDTAIRASEALKRRFQPEFLSL